MHCIPINYEVIHVAKSKWPTIQKYLPQIKTWIAKGNYEYQIVQKLKITKPTWEKYKKDYKELRDIIDSGKFLREQELIPELQNAVVKRALGYTEEEAEVKETTTSDEDGNVTIQKVKVSKKYPPDADAAMRLLKHFTKDKVKPFDDNPIETDIKKRRLQMEEKAQKIKMEGF